LKILVTGFEPWGDRKSNPSGDVAASLDGERFGEAEIVSAVLPVVHGSDTAVTFPLIEEHQPSAVVSLGLGSSTCLNVERVAVNLKNDDEPIVAGGPAAYFATLPTRAMAEAIVAGGVPARLSYHAGTFLCNHIMYSVLHHLDEEDRAIPAGFIHLPPTPQLVVDQGQTGASMSFEKIREGTVLALVNLVSFLSSS
jgi:pyroglutamyl-peptidase